MARSPGQGFACCNVHKGANFAPKLGVFVGCYHKPLDVPTQHLIQRNVAELHTKVEAIFNDPPPAADRIYNSGEAAML